MQGQAQIFVVPATPVKHTRDGSPNTDSSATSSWTQPPTPELSAVPLVQERKNSSETIFSIYSMYGASASGHRASVAVSPPDGARNSYRDSYFTSNGYATTSKDRSSKPLPPVQDWQNSPSDESATTEYHSAGTATPRLSYAASSSHRHSSSSSHHTRPPRSHPPSRHATPPMSYHPPDPSAVPLPASRPPSQIRDAPPDASPTIRISTALDRPSPTPSPKPLPSRPVSRQSSHLLQTPRSTMSQNSGFMSMRTSSASVHSPVQSAGEDKEAFFVRSTYAQLDAVGVKGDGIDEGVERTRARLGRNRASELRAEAAIDDGTEKTRELTSQEVELLSSLDRYGFFSVPSHDRLVSLPSAPLLKPLHKPTPVSTSGPPSAVPLSAMPPTHPLPKELSRMAKWNRMLVPDKRDIGGNIQFWTVKPSKEGKLRERTYKGIPDCWRAAAWEVLMSRYAHSTREDMDQLARDYREGLDKPSSYDIQIDLDVPRTISGHIMFRTRYGSGQRSLFHVLHSFSLLCAECGYCQGMGPIAATLLCYFDAERVYASLVRLHDTYAMHAIFAPGFPGLLEAIYLQERIMQRSMPLVYDAFKKHMVSTTSYATKWYITLFSNSVPFQTQLRLWDVFLCEGPDLFIVVAVAVVWVYRDHITSSAATFETVLSLLSSFFIPEDENALLAWIEKVLGDKPLRASMKQWREEWRGLVAAGKEGDALL